MIITVTSLAVCHKERASLNDVHHSVYLDMRPRRIDEAQASQDRRTLLECEEPPQPPCIGSSDWVPFAPSGCDDGGNVVWMQHNMKTAIDWVRVCNLTAKCTEERVVDAVAVGEDCLPLFLQERCPSAQVRFVFRGEAMEIFEQIPVDVPCVPLVNLPLRCNATDGGSLPQPQRQRLEEKALARSMNWSLDHVDPAEPGKQGDSLEAMPRGWSASRSEINERLEVREAGLICQDSYKCRQSS